MAQITGLEDIWSWVILFIIEISISIIIFIKFLMDTNL